MNTLALSSHIAVLFGDSMSLFVKGNLNFCFEPFLDLNQPCFFPVVKEHRRRSLQSPESLSHCIK